MKSRSMNEIEQMFYDAYIGLCEENDINDTNISFGSFELIPQAVVGIYKVDFLLGDCAIEIDGHEYHKTKEQREYDYKRERYLLMKGYIPVRFTGTEVFLEPERCVKEADDIASTIEMNSINSWIKGYEQGWKEGR